MADRIFIEENGKLSGPFSERQVQEWYRKGCFTEKVVQFCFMFEEANPVSSTEKFTMAELQSHNGIGCPFKWVDRSKVKNVQEERMEKERRMERIQKELSEFRAKCETIGELEKRIEKVKKLMNEKKISKTEKPVEQRDEKREAELNNFNKWTDFFADFYMTYLDALQTSDYTKINRDCDKGISQGNLIIEHEEARLMCVEKIIDKMKKRAFHFCTPCIAIMLNYRQCMIHILDPVHMQEVKGLNISLDKTAVISRRIITENLRTKWMAEDKAFDDELAKKYASVPVVDFLLRPTNHFFRLTCQRYSEIMFNKHCFLQGSVSKAMTAALNVWANEGLAAQLLTELNEHIGNKMTYCTSCKVVTGTLEEYYRHLLLSAHWDKEDKNFGAITIAVNIMKKDLIG